MLDIAVLFAALDAAVSAPARIQPIQIALSLDIRHPVESFALTLALGVAWYIALARAGLYRSHRLVGIRQQILEVAWGTAVCAVFVWLWLLLVYSEPRRDIYLYFLISIVFGLAATVSLSVIRIASGVIARFLRKRGYNLRHVVVVGSNRRATSYADSLKARAGWGYHLQGFIDDDWCDATTARTYQDKLLGRLGQLPEILRAMAIDELVVALPMASFYVQISQIVQLCKQHGILVRFTGSLFDSGDTRRSLRLEESLGTITLHDESWDVWGYMLKRFVDLSIAAILILLLSPLLGLIALLIKLDSPGPVFFLQTRLGLGKHPFKIYKFRTMVADAERLMKAIEHLNETEGPTFKLKNDPRITRFGSLLRKTSLDELPQLLNVLSGDMSLVGPRPLPLRDYEGFSHDWQRRRFSVKPGITCLWQIMGRSSITFDEWMALDMQYIDHWSMWLDLVILAKTIPAVLRGSGAV